MSESYTQKNMEENEYYSKPGISNSSLSAINPEQGGTPRRYKRYIIDRDSDNAESPSLKNGKIIHKYMEDPAMFKIDDLNKPSAMMSGWVESVFKHIGSLDVDKGSEPLRKLVLSKRGSCYHKMIDEDKLWAKFIKEGFEYLRTLVKGDEGKFVITAAEKLIILGAVDGIRANPKARELLFADGEEFDDYAVSELAIYWEIRISDLTPIPLECKSLIDRVKISPRTGQVQLIDGKTTSKPGLMFHESMRKFRYYRQLAFYTEALRYYLSEEHPEYPPEHWTFSWFIVSVETYGMYECFVYEVDEQWIDEGELEYLSLLAKIEYHIAEGWGSPTEEVDGILQLKYDK